MSQGREKLAGRVDEATAVYLEPLQGPPCPVCHRADGGHALGCPVPEYVAAWKQIQREHADRVWETLVGE